MADLMVLKTQQWLNKTYGGKTGYGSNINENGNTGWTTIYALTRALQIELGITSTVLYKVHVGVKDILQVQEILQNIFIVVQAVQ